MRLSTGPSVSSFTTCFICKILHLLLLAQIFGQAREIWVLVTYVQRPNLSIFADVFGGAILRSTFWFPLAQLPLRSYARVS